MGRRPLWLTSAALLLCHASHAASVAEELAVRLSSHDAARAVQLEIDTLAGKRVSVAATLADQRLADELATVRAQLDAARVHNERLQASVAAKREARAGMLPLLEQMLDLLSQSVAADLPFDRAARDAAIGRARRTLTDSTQRMTDRFDAVLDVYQDELRAGYEISVHSRQRQLGGQIQLVTLLKVGRIALYTVNEAGSECHVYARASESWQTLDKRHCLTLQAALDEPTAARLGDLPLSVEP